MEKDVPQIDSTGTQRSIALYSTRFHKVPAKLWPGKDARTLVSTLDHWDGAIGVIPG